MRNVRNTKGFTLIELMIVVVIIGILAAIAIPKFSQVSKNSKEAEAGPILKQICTLANTYRDQKGADAGNLTALVNVGWDASVDTYAKYYTFTLVTGTATATANKTESAGLRDYTMPCATGVLTEGAVV